MRKTDMQKETSEGVQPYKIYKVSIIRAAHYIMYTRNNILCKLSINMDYCLLTTDKGCLDPDRCFFSLLLYLLALPLLLVSLRVLTGNLDILGVRLGCSKFSLLTGGLELEFTASSLITEVTLILI